MTLTRIWLAVLLTVVTCFSSSDGRAQTGFEDSVTIDEFESLLIGAVDVNRSTLANVERSFFLKGNVPYPPVDADRLQLETVRGFAGKLFFFVKLRPLYETTQAREYTLAVRTPARGFRNLVTFPVAVRQCRPSEGKTVCFDGLTDLGSIVVKSEMSTDENGRGIVYTFSRTKDEMIQGAFQRRFELLEVPRDPRDESKGKLLSIRRR